MKAKIIKQFFIVSIILQITMQFAICESEMRVRIKDVTRIKGLESSTLVGYGLVIGLAGSGDSDEELTQRTISNLLKNFNIVVNEDSIKAQNTAAVVITATIDNMAHKGDMISATVSSIGDATSLTGGELLLTPLLGLDSKIWATGQGAVTTGGFSFGSSGAGGESKTKNHPTVGMLTNGIKLLKDVGLEILQKDAITLCIRQADFTTSANLAQAINSKYPGIAISEDAATVNVRVPVEFREEGRTSEFLRELEQMTFVPDQQAKIVFNERTGTLIFGQNVKISNVAVSHANLIVNIKNTESVIQPNPLAEGTTEKTSDQKTFVKEGNGNDSLKLLENVTTVGKLVSVLNALGATPRDIMIIMHALRDAGALHAKLESM